MPLQKKKVRDHRSTELRLAAEGIVGQNNPGRGGESPFASTTDDNVHEQFEWYNYQSNSSMISTRTYHIFCKSVLLSIHADPQEASLVKYDFKSFVN